MNTPEGASMKDCIFRAHDLRFHEVIGDSPQVVRLAQKDYEFAHEVRKIFPKCCCMLRELLNVCFLSPQVILVFGQIRNPPIGMPVLSWRMCIPARPATTSN